MDEQQVEGLLKCGKAERLDAGNLRSYNRFQHATLARGLGTNDDNLRKVDGRLAHTGKHIVQLG